MKILVVSSLYPPHVIGGYELGCRDVVDALRARGHVVRVLTSSYRLERPAHEGHVARVLQSEIGWDFAAPATGLQLFWKEVHNRRAIRQALAAFRPDLVYVWSLQNISLTPIMFAQQTGVPVVFYSSDEWLAHWAQRDRWLQVPHDSLRRAAKRMLNMAANTLGGHVEARLDFANVECTSAYICAGFAQAGAPLERAQVIHWGIDLGRFPYRAAVRSQRTRLLYVGQVIAHKGVHTAVAAVERLGRLGIDATLTVVGRAASAAYQQQLEALARGGAGRVRFAGAVPRERLAEIYAAHDILIFPSVWQEPFSITLLEALASGLAVVSTATGGTPEVLTHGHNALLFAPEDVDGCAAQVAQLAGDAAQYERIRACGRATVEQGFQLGQMVEKIEQHLKQVIA